MKQPDALHYAKVMEDFYLGLGRLDATGAATELRRLHAIEEAAKNLVKVKGRYHTEQAFNKLKELLT